MKIHQNSCRNLSYFNMPKIYKTCLFALKITTPEVAYAKKERCGTAGNHSDSKKLGLAGVYLLQGSINDCGKKIKEL